jgi:hypothetical protein
VPTAGEVHKRTAPERDYFNVRCEHFALYLINKVNAEATMNLIETLYGPFDQAEIDFYFHELGDYDAAINSFQKRLIFNLFYKYFGNTISANSINRIDYIKLMIAAKRILQSQCLVMLPYVISSRVDKLISRKSVNRKDLVKIQSSELYPQILRKYQEIPEGYGEDGNELMYQAGDSKIVKELLGMIATVLSSDFTIIDYNDPSINGKTIEIIPDIIIEEFLIYVMLI